MISQSHTNRQPHNWLAYDTSDRLLVKYCQFYRGVIYDLGAGEAPYKEFFLRYANAYIAVDWANTYHKSSADIVADLNSLLPIDSEVADAVVSLSVLEHLCDPAVMLSEAFRILKSGGGLVLQVPWQWWVHEAPYDYYRYTPYGLQYLLKNAGFACVVVEPQAGFFTMMVLKFNYFTLRFIRGPRLLRLFLRGGLGFFWFLGQKIAPLLDRLLDRNWQLEASGYFVTARKP